MTKTELFLKLLQGIVIVTITAFFLLPYFHAGTALFGNAHSLRQEKILSPIGTSPTNVPVTDAAIHYSWDQKPVTYTPDNLGINLPWLDLHNGKQAVNWLNTQYSATLIDNDLSGIQAMGITKIRSFCQMESVFNFKEGKFVLNEQYARNLDDFLNQAEKHGVSVICVMGDGNYEGTPADLDGYLRWDLIQKPDGLQVYKDAYIYYINRFKTHKNILMWDMINEPYSSITWSFSAKAQHVTREQVHTFLVQSYQTIKPLVGNTYVGFSDLEEEEQTMYQLFSSETTRKTFVDDCTDVYAMHIYRATASQVADFRNLTSKPKWVLELGAYNYDDPDAKDHPIPAANELYNTEENYIAVLPISRKLLNSGFSLIMPWGFSANDGMVKHNPDGSHTLLKLTQFIKDQLLSNKSTHPEPSKSLLVK